MTERIEVVCIILLIVNFVSIDYEIWWDFFLLH